MQYHDFIHVLLLSHERIIKQCPSLYKKGMSLREIAEKTNIPKSTILKTFKKYKVTRRQTKIGQAPYGFAYLEEKLVVDPKEYLIVRKIISFHHRGYSMRAISRELNSRKLFNRKGTKWHNGVIKSVIECHKKDNILHHKIKLSGENL